MTRRTPWHPTPVRALFPLLLMACQSAVNPPVPVPASDPSAAYQALLQRVVTPDGYVDWDLLERDHQALDDYVAWLSRPGALPADPVAAHATWLNAYNAWTLYGVLDTGTPDSVRDVAGWVPQPGSGFFLERTYTLGGQRVSLYVAEHTHIRAEIGDWRDHAALNCASASCPPLRQELYDPSRLDAQLDDQVRRWADDPIRGWQVEGETFTFSPIFSWFEADFPTSNGGLCALLAPYAQTRSARLVQGAEAGCSTTFFTYDWRLNRPEVRNQPPAR